MKTNTVIMCLLHATLRGKSISTKEVMLYDQGFSEYKIAESES